MGYGPRDHIELEMTERLSTQHTHTEFMDVTSCNERVRTGQKLGIFVTYEANARPWGKAL